MERNRGELTDDESGHFVGDWGPLQSERGPLVNVGDLVHLMTQGAEGVPLRPAAVRLLNALRDRPTVALYVTQPGDFAQPVVSDWPLEGGRAAVVGSLCKYWDETLRDRRQLYPKAARGQLAILLADAAELFPELFTTEPTAATAAPPGQPACQVIQPEGGQWPHAHKATWTASERDALFAMRHRGKWPDAELLKRITPPGRKAYTRKLLHELIGPQQLKHDSFAGKAWEPSDELLKSCGLQRPASPMPRLAAAATAER